MRHKQPIFIWTRPLDNWKLDQKKLLLANLTQIIHIPCFQQAELTTVIPHTLSQASHYSIAFTSSLGVQLFLKKSMYKPILSKAKFYAFGQQTTHTLQHYGINVHNPSTIHSGEAFAAYLNNTLNKGHHVLLPGGTKRAFDLESYLTHKGFQAQNIHCYHTTYRTTNIYGNALSFSQCLEIANKRSVIAFTSPLSTVAFVKAFEPHSDLLRKNMIAVAIGQTTHRSCQRFFTKTVVAKKPSIDHLIQTCQVLLESPNF